MNVNKKTDSESGWLLCPSKKNPGKFYYFNVVTGESVWSFDVDNIGVKESNLQNVPVYRHSSHEPPEAGPSTTNTQSFRPYYEPRSPYVQPVPIFGQPSFSKYAPDQELRPNIVWAPIQLPVFGQETKKPLIDKVTQTSQSSSLTDSEILDRPEINQNKRSKSHENLFLSFEGENQTQQHNFRTSTPKKIFVYEDFTPSDEDSSGKLILPFTPEKNNQISTLTPDDKVETARNKELGLEEEKMLENLESTDLRFLLIAKRRKTIDAGINGSTEKKVFELKKPTPRKRVTFNMSNIEKVDDNHINHTIVSNTNRQHNYQPITAHEIQPGDRRTDSNASVKTTTTNQSNNIKVLERPEIQKNVSLFAHENKTKYLTDHVKSDTWFLVTDTDVLLLDYEAIDKIVLSDAKCKLLIPYAVRRDIEALCVGDCQGQQRVKNARQITRRLAALPPHYILQPCPDDETTMVTTESVLKCCFQATTFNHHVILVTNDPYLQAKADLLNIKNKKLNDFKHNFNPSSPFTPKKLLHPNHATFNENNIVKENSLNCEVKNLPKDNLTYSLFDCDSPINVAKLKPVKINESNNPTTELRQIVRNITQTDLKSKPIVNNTFISKNITQIPMQNKFQVTSALADVSCPTEKKEVLNFENLNLEDDFDRFTVKTQIMNEKLSTRMDEWLCTYTQIIEDVLHALIQISSGSVSRTVAPLSLQETFNSIKIVYINNVKIKIIVRKLTELLDKCSTKIGKLILAPDDFMTILGYGVLLIQELKSIQPLSKELKDAATNMSSLLNNIENDTLEVDLDCYTKAPVSRSEYDDRQDVRANFVKDPSHVIDYLRKHYPQWAEYADKNDDVNEKSTIKNDYNVLRTSGKHLNKLKIDSSKNISLNTQEDVNNTSKTIKLVNQINIKNQNIDKTLENQQKTVVDTNDNKNINITEYINYQDISKFKENNNKKEIPNMIGTNNIIDSKKIRESLDLDALDYSEIEYSKHTDNRINNEEVVNNNSDATISDIDNYLIDKQTINNDIVVISDDSTCLDENTDQNKYKNNSKNNDIPKTYNINSKFNENTSKMYNIIPKFNENTPKLCESSKKIAILNESYTKNGTSFRDDNTNDSGFENDSTFALSAVKLFFSELCSTFRITHKLIGQCRLLISKEDLCEMKKKQFRYQASKSLEYLTPIMQHLESIIKRESAEETVLKNLLLKAGLEASMDKRMTHYRQIAIKFLEQAHILEFGLKSIVSITSGNFTALPATEVTTSNYFNIFE